ncbi:hypothetical protein FRACYDRAFT_236502 [Fragilariopsis cylindrus CCMP1102]|uniref:Uncharacterized protein n=1 Tax=Fragilariopsis cylindrus CCMP1102 TaxID=635003 RepID=A0A1E7FJ80_9STRA|nr:hypothetical protein FRACYDRAFT_236502 [Fragilariopsis cylindrus CCMP1102]|eukprot:OEU18231.1 hypothetical protein FRACYDRAFT_236502 [Fragilariopsis cylindrus CCMP1102]
MKTTAMKMRRRLLDSSNCINDDAEVLLMMDNSVGSSSSSGGGNGNAKNILDDLHKMAKQIDIIAAAAADDDDTDDHTDTTMVSTEKEGVEQRDEQEEQQEQEQFDEYKHNDRENENNDREKGVSTTTTTRSRTTSDNGSDGSDYGVYPDRSLWKLLSEQRWEWAEERLRIYPEEAKQMIHFPTPSTTSYCGVNEADMMVLPLHMACSMRPLPPTSLIEDLVDAYPVACQIKQLSTGLLPIHMIVDLSKRSPDMNQNIIDFNDFNENEDEKENHVKILDLLLEKYPDSIMATEKIHDMIPLQIAACTTRSENGIVTPIIASLFHLLIDKTVKASAKTARAAIAAEEKTDNNNNIDIDSIIATYKDKNGFTAYDWSWKNVNYFCSRCGMEEDRDGNAVAGNRTTIVAVAATRRMPFPMKCNCNQLVSVTEDVLHPLLKKEICSHVRLLDGNARKEEERRGRKFETAEESIVAEVEAIEAAAALTANGIAIATIRYESDHDFMLFSPPSSHVPPPCWSSLKVLSSTTTTSPAQRSVAAAAAVELPTLLVEPNKTARSASFARLQGRLAQQQQQQQHQQPVEEVSKDIASVAAAAAAFPTLLVEPNKTIRSASFARLQRRLAQQQQQQQQPVEGISKDIASLLHAANVQVKKEQQRQPHAPYNRYSDNDDPFYSFDTLQYSESFSTSSSYDSNDDDIVDVSAPEQEQQQREEQKDERRLTSKEVDDGGNNKTILSTRVLDNIRDKQQEEEDCNKEEKTAILHMKIRLSELVYPSNKKIKKKNGEYKYKNRDGKNSKKKQMNPYFEIFAAHRGGMSRSYYRSYPLMNSNDGTWEDAFLDLGLTHSQLKEASGGASHVEIGIRVMNIPSKGNIGTSEIKRIGTCQVGLETLEQQQQQRSLRNNIIGNDGDDVDEEENVVIGEICSSVDQQGPEKFSILNGYHVMGKLQVLSLRIE